MMGEEGGLALAEAFFRECRDQLHSVVPDVMARAAVGLVGDGSECYGYDDGISRDHDWGPAFCIWLPAAELDAALPRLEAALDLLPSVFAGYGTRMRPEQRMGRVGPLSIEGFHAGFGIAGVPQTWQEWRALEETSLAACTNGKVFEDPAGVFTGWRDALLAYYPEDVRRKKIAARCMMAAQSGQYNLARSLQRDGYATAQICASTFVGNALSLCHLLSRRYMPFYKWACRSAASLPEPGPSVAALAERLAESRWRDEAWGMETIGAIESLCTAFADVIRRQGMAAVSGNWLWEVGIDVQNHISTPCIRALNAMKD